VGWERKKKNKEQMYSKGGRSEYQKDALQKKELTWGNVRRKNLKTGGWQELGHAARMGQTMGGLQGMGGACFVA